MSNNEQTVDQDDDDDLAKERDLLASLIEKLKCEIDDSKNRNKFLESSKKALVDKLKIEIEDFKNKNKSLESLNNHFKEENNELSKTNQLMFKDLKKFQDELEKRHDVNYMSKVELDVIPITSVSRPQLKSNRMEDRVMPNNSQGKAAEPIVVPISTRELKQNANQSVATSHKKTVATESTVKKNRSIIRELYEQVRKTCQFVVPSLPLSGYKWKP
ncbi:hypothetical protein Tco_0491173 [Tanacetum coccineum]